MPTRTEHRVRMSQRVCVVCVLYTWPDHHHHNGKLLMHLSNAMKLICLWHQRKLALPFMWSVIILNHRRSGDCPVVWPQTTIMFVNAVRPDQPYTNRQRFSDTALDGFVHDCADASYTQTPTSHRPRSAEYINPLLAAEAAAAEMHRKGTVPAIDRSFALRLSPHRNRSRCMYSLASISLLLKRMIMTLNRWARFCARQSLSALSVADYRNDLQTNRFYFGFLAMNPMNNSKSISSGSRNDVNIFISNFIRND